MFLLMQSLKVLFYLEAYSLVWCILRLIWPELLLIFIIDFSIDNYFFENFEVVSQIWKNQSTFWKFEIKLAYLNSLNIHLLNDKMEQRFSGHTTETRRTVVRRRLLRYLEAVNTRRTAQHAPPKGNGGANDHLWRGVPWVAEN